MKKVIILAEGSDPIIVSGSGTKFQVPLPDYKKEAKYLEKNDPNKPWITSFSGAEIGFPVSTVPNYSIRLAVLQDLLMYVHLNLDTLPKDNTYVIYEVSLNLDTHTIEFDVEATTSPIEIDLESENNIDKETIKNNISGLISYE